MAELNSPRWPWMIAIGAVLVAIIVVVMTWGKDAISPPVSPTSPQSQTQAESGTQAGGQSTGKDKVLLGDSKAPVSQAPASQPADQPSAPPPPKALPHGAKVVKIITPEEQKSGGVKISDSPTGGSIETATVQTGEVPPQSPREVKSGSPTAKAADSQTAKQAVKPGASTIQGQAAPPGAVKKTVKDAQGNVKVVWVNPDGSITTSQAVQSPAAAPKPASPAETSQAPAKSGAPKQTKVASSRIKPEPPQAKPRPKAAEAQPQAGQARTESSEAASSVSSAPVRIPAQDSVAVPGGGQKPQSGSGQAQPPSPADQARADEVEIQVFQAKPIKAPTRARPKSGQQAGTAGETQKASTPSQTSAGKQAAGSSKPAEEPIKARVIWAKPRRADKSVPEVPKPDTILEARKKPYGIQKSLDVVVRSDEIIELAGVRIPVAELERQMVVEQRGEVLEKPLDRPAQISAWGVYLVRKGDHLWGVHFHLLSDYLNSKGVKLARHADRPLPNGRSSGVGKILKFAENMVGVYNIKTGAMDENLDLIEPGEKVVVYNLTEIFEQLSKIDPHDLSGIEYDGRVLFFPKTKQGIKAPASSDEG